MSIQSSRSEIQRLKRAIADLQGKLSDESKKAADKNRRILQERQSISSSRNQSLIQSKERSISSLQDDVARIEDKKAALLKEISTKTEQLHRKEAELDREEAAERKKREEEDAKRDKKRQEEDDRREKRRHEQEQAVARELASHQRQLEELASYGPQTPVADNGQTREHDVFISHASEDKDELVRPLAKALATRGLRVWYDEFVLTVGDSLRRNIDRGLASSRFGVVVISTAFFSKNWPRYELDGLAAKENHYGRKVILPLWHKVTKDEVIAQSPTLADRVALDTARYTIEELANELAQVIVAPNAEPL